MNENTITFYIYIEIKYCIEVEKLYINKYNIYILCGESNTYR